MFYTYAQSCDLLVYHSSWEDVWGAGWADYSRILCDCLTGGRGNIQGLLYIPWKWRWKRSKQVISKRKKENECKRSISERKMRKRDRLIREDTYDINFSWISNWNSTRLSSLSILKSIRRRHARLCVSCFIRFGLALPLKPKHQRNNGFRIIVIVIWKMNWWWWVCFNNL